MKLNEAEREQRLGETKKHACHATPSAPPRRVPRAARQAIDDPKRLKNALLSLRLRATAREDE